MMRKLFLLRHAEAEDRFPDASRALTHRGRKSVVDLANFLPERVRLDIGVIWHSPLVRAVETASIFRETAGLSAEMIECDGLLPMDDPEAIAAKLENESRNALIVGHNPHFEGLAAQLLGLNEGRVPVNVPKASLLRFKRFGGNWQLRDLITTSVSGSGRVGRRLALLSSIRGGAYLSRGRSVVVSSTIRIAATYSDVLPS